MSEPEWEEEMVTEHPSDEEMEFLYNVEEAIVEASHVLVTKHKDYGPSNISDAPGGPLVGLSVRLHDKVARLTNLMDKQDKINYEPLHDTFLDIANYGIIGMMVVDGKWPNGKGNDGNKPVV